MSPLEFLIDLPRIKKLPFPQKRAAFLEFTKRNGIEALLKEPFPRQISELPPLTEPSPRRANLYDELEWISLILQPFSTTLKRHCELRLALDNARWGGNWEESGEILDSIDQEIGKSFLFCERLMESVLNRDGGAVSDEYLKSFIDATSDPSVNFFIAANYFRFNAIYPYAAYAKILENNIESFSSWGESVKLNILYHCDSASPIGPSYLAAICSTSNRKPVVDQYELAVYSITSLFQFELPPEDYKRLNLIRNRLYNLTGDSRISPKDSKATSADLDKLTVCSMPTDGERVGNLCSLVANASDGDHAYGPELFGLLSAVSKHGQFIEMTTVEMAGWASKVGRSVLADSIYQLSRYLRGHAHLHEVLSSGNHQLTGDSPLKSIFEVLDDIENKRPTYEKIKSSDGPLASALFLLKAWSENPWSIRALETSDELVGWTTTFPPEKIEHLPLLAVMGLLDQGVAFTSSLDAFLFFIGVDSVSAIANTVPNELQWVYNIFITECCGLPVLKEIPGIGESMQEVRAERIKLLKLLIQRGSPKAELFKKEVFELEKRNRIEGANIIIDQSRMMVDSATLAEKIETRFLSKLNRPKVGDLSTGFLQMLQLNAVGIFLLDRDCSLDAVLSGRIRHGNLRERLRSPFARTNLIFSRRKDTGEYQPSERWWNEFWPSAEDKENLVEAIKDLSLEADSLISHFISEKVQFHLQDTSWEGFSGMLTAKKSPEGLISVDELLADSIEMLYEAGSGISDVSSLVAKSIECIWDALAKQLEKVRTELISSLGKDLIAAIDRFSSKFDSLPIWKRTIIRDATVRCKTEVRSVCDETAKWFDLPKELTPPSVNVVEMVELVAESIRRYTGGVFDVTVSGLSKGLVGKLFFNDFYDLINILFVNIVDHSGLDGAEVDVSFSVKKCKGGFEVVCSNRVAGDLDKHVTSAQTQISDNRKDSTFEKLNREGRSGLAKIESIIARQGGDLETLHVLDQNGKFCLRMKLPPKVFSL